jgi:hypothetical protein
MSIFCNQWEEGKFVFSGELGFLSDLGQIWAGKEIRANRYILGLTQLVLSPFSSQNRLCCGKEGRKALWTDIFRPERNYTA